MREEGALRASASGQTGRERGEALGLLAESQQLLVYIIVGVLLQYHSLDLERQKLLGQGGEGAFNMQAAASLISLGALFGFQNQAERLACQTAQAGEAADMMDVKLGATSILVLLIRLFRLMASRSEGEMEEVEELTEPIVE